MACWLSKNWIVARHEREAIGRDGEKYSWSRLWAGEAHGGRFTSLCEFDVDDEEAAFAYAEERMQAASSRLPLSNSASRVVDRSFDAMRANAFAATIELRSKTLVYDDRRRISGALIGGIEELGAGLAILLTQYQQFENRTLAVRGDRFYLGWSRWQDDTGNEAVHLNVIELGEDGLISYEGRFDEDDFDKAYRELENRYYAGEGAAFADNGRIADRLMHAMDSLDVDAARPLCTDDFRFFTPPATMTAPERSLDEFFRWVQERASQVASVKNFGSVLCWLSPSCFVALGNVRATGAEGEDYDWARHYVFEFRDGLLAAIRQFDDEESAFAYAEDRISVPASKLAVRNLASDTFEILLRAMQSHDVDAAIAVIADDISFDDHRSLTGDPIHGKTDARVALQRILVQFNRFESHVLGVRGDLLALFRSRWSDDGGNETTYLHVVEVGDGGRIVADARFDEDDFIGAFQELEERYYSGEGAAFAEAGKTASEFMVAGNTGDLEKMFGELATPELRVESRSGTIFPDRTATDLRGSIELFQAMVSSSQTWMSVVTWLSPHCVVARQEREAVGDEGERYEWNRIYVVQFDQARLTAICEFELEFEEQAFAYAEEQIRAAQSRLTVRNRASDVAQRFISALRDRDLERILSFSSDDLALDDRRRLAASSASHASEPNLRCGQEFMRAAGEGLLRQFNTFELGALAVRGDRLALCVGRWSDDSGNESVHYIVFELIDDGRLGCLVYFDDDFEGAYQELEKRYYEREGAAFARPGLALAEYCRARSRGDNETVFRDLTTPDFRVESRSHSVFLDRSADDYRWSLEELGRRVASVREWLAQAWWLSPRWCVGLFQRAAVGNEGEQYEWTRIVVGEVRGGRLASVCDFDLEDEDAAFAYAEEQARIDQTPLTVSNRASESADSVIGAFRTGDLNAAVDHYSDDYVFEDRRQLSGDALRGKAAVRANIDLLLRQFETFEWRTTAVRGDTLALCWNRWSDGSGNQSSSFQLVETDRDGLEVYGCRFDEDDFEGAYRELETRYYAGEGAAYAHYGLFNAEYVATMNRGDFDTMFNELSHPDLSFENRSRSVFPDRSAEELRANFKGLYAMLPSVRSWFSALRWVSPTTYVGRLEREGVGQGDERYAWSMILVNEYRDGQLASITEFEADEDEAAAIAFAEELAAQT